MPMISSAALPNVALSRPPSVGPAWSPVRRSARQSGPRAARSTGPRRGRATATWQEGGEHPGEGERRQQQVQPVVQQCLQEWRLVPARCPRAGSAHRGPPCASAARIPVYWRQPCTRPSRSDMIRDARARIGQVAIVTPLLQVCPVSCPRAVPQVREPAAHRGVQDPRRLQHDDEARRRRDCRGADHVFVGQSRPGRGVCRETARFAGGGRDAGDAPSIKVEGARLGAEVIFEGRTSIERKARAEAEAAAWPGDRAAVRSSRHHGRPGHDRPRDPRAVPGCRHAVRAGQRWRPDLGHRDRPQGAEAGCPDRRRGAEGAPRSARRGAGAGPSRSSRTRASRTGCSRSGPAT